MNLRKKAFYMSIKYQNIMFLDLKRCRLKFKVFFCKKHCDDFIPIVFEILLLLRGQKQKYYFFFEGTGNILNNYIGLNYP